MLHSPEDRIHHGGEIGNLADISNPAAIQAANTFWRIVKDRLGELNPQTPRFYLEGYTRPSLRVIAGTSNLPGENQNPPIEDKIMTEFIKRVGGTVETTEGTKLLEEAFGVHRDLGDMLTSLAEQVANGGAVDLEDQVQSRLISQFATMDAANSRREEFIASRINSTLQEGETGFLFLGGAHDLSPKLLPDIQVEVLDERLVEIRNELKESMMEGESETKGEPTFDHGSEGKF